MRAALLALSLLLALPAHAQRLVVHGGPIWTVDAARPQAEAFAVEDGAIVAVGDHGAVVDGRADWPALDLEGRAVIPGLIDAHGHLMNLGLSLLQVDLIGAASLDETLDRIAAFAAELPDGAWVQGRGWDQTDWPAAPDGSYPFPTRADLDRVVPDRPVFVKRVDGHATWTNTAALRAAGIDPDAPAPADRPDGRFLRDASGRPTGLFIDAADDVVEAAIPPRSAAETEAALERALAETARLGLTGVHDVGLSAGVTPEVLALYERAIEAGRFPIRVHTMWDADVVAEACASGAAPRTHPSGRLQARAVKLYSDGALGSRGAALLADYSDDPGNRGLLFRSEAELQALVESAMRCGLQVNTHAIGDRGNRLVLDVYQRALAATGGGPGRHRIEHAQVVRLEDIPRFAEHGVIASVQPTHATSDMPWAEARVGAERIRGAYAWRRLVDAGARVALGSDFPVERPDPLAGVYAAVTRQDASGAPAGGWFGNQALTRAEALRGFTLDAAYAGFMEDAVGSLEVGKRADFVVLSGDLMRVPAEQILDLRVVATYLDGEPVYQE